MLCPRCQQLLVQMREGKCPLCDYPCAGFYRRVKAVQVMVGAIFASTLTYGVVVAVLELVVGYQAPATGIPEHVLGGALLVAAGTVALLLWKMGTGMLAAGNVDAAQRGFALLAACAELPAVSGLLLYLLTGSIVWFVILLGASWAFFLRLGVTLPEHLNRLREELGRG